MPEKIYVGNFPKGLIEDRLPFVIDNESFPTMINAYVWRGRVKRKRGTSQIGRLQRQLSAASAGNITLTLPSPNTFNIIVALGLNVNASITPGNLAPITITIGAQTLTDISGTGVLTVSAGNITAATINYSTGILTISFTANSGPLAVTFTGSYYPELPVMGLEDLSQPSGGQFPILLAFDTTYAYQFNQTVSPPFFYNVSYYQSSQTPLIWTGQDFQQFWTTNYQGALWATNNKPGLNLAQPITVITQLTPTTLQVTVPNTFIVNDYTFLFEITETPVPGGLTLNGVSGKVTTAGNPFIMTVPAGTYNTYVSGGISQYLTQSNLANGDGIRWYNGDPTGGTGLPTTASNGWVNFMPPVSMGPFGFDNLNAQQYYLAGALAIVAFKDRLLFFGPFIQSKSDANATLLADTVIWSWNGTPYYAQPTPITPTATQYGYDPTAYFVNVTGKGGYLSAGISQPIVTINNNEDVLLVGFTNRQTRFVYTGNDLDPFLFYSINSEIGSSATFSGITLDRGGLTIGSYGIALTSQISTQRIDLQIPDEVFQISQLPIASVLGVSVNTGPLRVNASRDFYKEWIYFSYPVANSPWIYPTQTFLYNYRDNTWAILIENYTAHGNFRSNFTMVWATVDNTYPTWSTWNDPWNSAVSEAKFPSICAGNQQGFVMQLSDGTSEGQSQYIKNITPVVGNPLSFTISSPNHCLLNDDFLYLQGITGTSSLNGQIGRVGLIITAGVEDPNNFTLTFKDPQTFTDYFGAGTYARLCRPLVQTKQFGVYWNEGRQVRLGVQKYLFDYTPNGQITLAIFLSMDPDNPYNYGDIVPQVSTNNALIYSDILFTSPEANNLQTPTASSQFQIWHRMNTSLIGDTFQIGFTLSDDQMYDFILATSEIALQAMQFDVSRGPYLS